MTPKTTPARVVPVAEVLTESVDDLRQLLRRREAGEEVEVIGRGASATMVVFEALLQENERHRKIIEDWLAKRNLKWDGKKVAEDRPGQRGAKRGLRSVRVEAALRDIGDADGKDWTTLKVTTALLKRVRNTLSWTVAVVPEQELRDLVNNAQRSVPSDLASVGLKGTEILVTEAPPPARRRKP